MARNPPLGVAGKRAEREIRLIGGAGTGSGELAAGARQPGAAALPPNQPRDVSGGIVRDGNVNPAAGVQRSLGFEFSRGAVAGAEYKTTVAIEQQREAGFGVVDPFRGDALFAPARRQGRQHPGSERYAASRFERV